MKPTFIALVLWLVLVGCSYRKTDFRVESSVRDSIVFIESPSSFEKRISNYRASLLEVFAIGESRTAIENRIKEHFRRTRENDEFLFLENAEAHDGKENYSVLLWEKGSIPAGSTHFRAFFIFDQNQLDEIVIEYDSLWL